MNVDDYNICKLKVLVDATLLKTGDKAACMSLLKYLVMDLDHLIGSGLTEQADKDYIIDCMNNRKQQILDIIASA